MTAQIAHHDPTYAHTLPDGSIVRWAQPGDIQGYVDLCANVFKPQADSEYNRYVAKYCRDFTSSSHPHCSANELAVVVNAAQEVVAGTMLMRAPMNYAGIDIAMGKPEVVATHPAYRSRGYIREIFKLLHARSHARGDLLQGITGVPYIYERLGYHYAIDYEQRTTVHITPHQHSTHTPAIQIRRAAVDEYSQFVELYDAERHARNQMITTPIDFAYYKFLLTDSTSIHIWMPTLICAPDSGEVIGFMLLANAKVDNKYTIYGLGLKPGFPLAQYLPAIINATAQFRQLVTLRHTQDETVNGLVFDLDATHPAHHILRGISHATYDNGYTWYIRVPDVPALIQRIRPVIEQRIAASEFRGITHQFSVSLYDATLEFTWKDGVLQAISQQAHAKGGSATNRYTLPLLLKQLFGRNSYDEMRRWHHELARTAYDGALLDTMFPKQVSWFMFQS